MPGGLSSVLQWPRLRAILYRCPAADFLSGHREHQVEFQARLVEATLPCDLTATVQIAKWVYQQTEKANGQVWVMEKVLRHLGPGWSQCFAA
jgi:hypothetical protein